MSANELLLIDLSGIAHQAWHADPTNPDPTHVSTKTIARVRALASAHPHAAVCCDNGKSFRVDIDPNYKANRDTENRAPLRHQMMLACETLKRDGFPVWSVPGFEGDDIIATATRMAMEIPETTVLIASDDKDLLSLVSDRVKVHRLTSGLRMDTEAVIAKLKVKPSQVPDYLALLGDKSDNIIGAKGIGEKHASDLLTAHGTLDAIYHTVPLASLKPSIAASLTEFKDRWPTVAKLVALRTDAPIEFSDIAAERTAQPMENAEMAEPFKQGDDSNDAPLPWSKESAPSHDSATGPVSAPTPEATSTAMVKAQAPATVSSESVSAPAPVEWELQLEPRSYRDVRVFASDMHESRKFMRNFGSAQAVIAAVVAGRELGLPAMASLRGFHSIEDGPPMPNADTVRGIIIDSGKVEYFEPTERSDKAAEFAIKRHGRPEVRLRFTIEEGRTAFGFDVPMNDAARADLERKWVKSGWGKNVADMLVARASMKLGRLVCPDVCAGLYSTEEFNVLSD